MAGTLPGVEAARRRRFHQKINLSYGPDNHFSPAMSGYGISSTRRPSFCLYATNHEFRLCSNLRNTISQVAWDESRLGAEAREAKKRLDERLQPQWRSEAKRPALQADIKAAEAPKLKRKGSKRLNWLKLRWKSWQQEECPVCLEQLRSPLPKPLMQLRCGHKFHTNCLVRWLESKPLCPCCRMEIAS